VEGCLGARELLRAGRRPLSSLCVKPLVLLWEGLNCLEALRQLRGSEDSPASAGIVVRESEPGTSVVAGVVTHAEILRFMMHLGSSQSILQKGVEWIHASPGPPLPDDTTSFEDSDAPPSPLPPVVQKTKRKRTRTGSRLQLFFPRSGSAAELGSVEKARRGLHTEAGSVERSRSQSTIDGIRRPGLLERTRAGRSASVSSGGNGPERSPPSAPTSQPTMIREVSSAPSLRGLSERRVHYESGSEAYSPIHLISERKAFAEMTTDSP